jgi:hypothetical protein
MVAFSRSEDETEIVREFFASRLIKAPSYGLGALARTLAIDSS